MRRIPRRCRTPRLRRAGRAEVRHRERNGSAPCPRPATAAVRAGSPGWIAGALPSSEMDPLVQRRGFARIGGEIFDELRHARILPGLLEVAPDLCERLAP